MQDWLAERLGLDGNSAAIIVSCGELGFCHAVNTATFELLRDNYATSTSLMVPAPWARAAAADYRGEDVGIDLTITSELDRYRWGPITQAPSLLDGDGAFPRTVGDVWEHADLDEVRKEWRAQIERAVLWGFDVSHLVVHMNEIEQRPEFFDVFLDLAEDFRLPIRPMRPRDERLAGFPLQALTEERGVLCPDTSTRLFELGDSADAVSRSIRSLPPGLHEITCRVAKDCDEVRAATPHWKERTDAYRILTEIEWSSLDVLRTSYRRVVQAMRERR